MHVLRRPNPGSSDVLYTLDTVDTILTHEFSQANSSGLLSYCLVGR